MPRTRALLEAGFVSDVHLRVSDRQYHVNGLHFDGGDFFSMQIDGVKRWTMVDPAHALDLYADHVYPPPGPSYGLQVFRRTGVDVTRLTRIVDTPTLQASAYPGDMLYNPQRWWHEIENMPGRNIGVVLSTSFPSPAALMNGAVDGPTSAGFYSRHLLTFAALWRREGAAGMPAALRACADATDTEDSVIALWNRALDSTVRDMDGSDNSRSL